NLSDGPVEVIAEGPEAKLNELSEFCRNNPGYSNVTNIEIKKEKSTDEFDSFEVRY
ncbi:unnamed protein product, partial [marine sediment metagenome]